MTCQIRIDALAVVRIRILDISILDNNAATPSPVAEVDHVSSAGIRIFRSDITIDRTGDHH